MKPIKQGTAATVKIGPFLDSTDAVTPEASLTIQKADVRLSKAGGDFGAASADQGASDAGAPYDELGFYDVSLDATDTDTPGRLRIAASKSGALPVWEDFVVFPAVAYDALIAGTDNLQVDAIQVEGGDATDALQSAAAAALAAYDPPTHAELTAAVGSVTLAADQSAVTALGGIDVTGPAIPAESPTRTLQAATTTVLTLATDEPAVDDALVNWTVWLPTIGRTALVTDYVGATRAATVVDAATGAALASAPAAGDSYQPQPPVGVIGSLTAGSADVGTAVRTELATELARVDVAVSTRSDFDPAADAVDLNPDQSGVTIGTVSTLAGHTPQTGDTFALASGANGFAAIAAKTNLIADVGVSGSVSGSGSASSFDGAAGLSSSDDFYNGAIMAFTSGNLKGIARRITDYAGATRTFTFASAFPAAPADGDDFLVLGRIDA